MSAFAPVEPHHKTLEIQPQPAQFTAVVFVLMTDEIDLTDDYILQRGLYLFVFLQQILPQNLALQ